MSAQMKVRQLEAFQEVVMSGSVTRAAERMNISQPAVSQLLGQLERFCGFKLFDRRGGKIVPTREAEALFTEVRQVFVGVDRIARVATALREQSWGSVRIAAFPAIARRIVPEAILGFQRNHSEARFHLQSMRSRSVIDAVARQHADIGICSMPGDRSEIDSVYVQTMRAVCIVPAAHRLATAPMVHARDLEGENFVSLGSQDQSKNIVDRIFDQLNVSRTISIESGQSETVYTFVIEAAGVSVVDPLCVYNANGLDDPRVRVLRFTPLIDFGVWLIRPKSGRALNLVDNFEISLIKYIADKLSGIDDLYCARR